MRGGALLAFAGIATLQAAKPLSLPEEIPYQPLQFDAATLTPGHWAVPVPQDWQVVSLDGVWKFKEVPYSDDIRNPLTDLGMTAGYFKGTFDDSSWQDLSVPSRWPGKRSGNYQKGGLGWHRRSFEVSAGMLKNQGRIVVDFRRAAWQTDVWVNGKKAGERNAGRFNSFQYDITDLVAPGQNTLAVRVYEYLGHTSYLTRHLPGINHPVPQHALPAPVHCHKMRSPRC
jgi:beta-galactosidase/beta-glucuronidase